MYPCAVHLGYPADQSNAIAGELMKVQCMSACRPADMRLGGDLFAWRSKLINGSVVNAERIIPPIDVLSPISARCSPGAAYAQIDLSAALIQLLRDLRAGLRTTRHQCSPIG